MVSLGQSSRRLISELVPYVSLQTRKFPAPGVDVWQTETGRGDSGSMLSVLGIEAAKAGPALPRSRGTLGRRLGGLADAPPITG